MLCISLYADADVIATHPASNPGGRLLTNEEANTAVTRPRLRRFEWQDAEHFFFRDREGKRHIFSVNDTSENISDAKRPEQAFKTKGGSLYHNGKCIQQGGDGIVYGESVSRNEFGIDGGIFLPATKSSRMAFYRKDESAVTQFPLLDINSRTGSLKSIRYPMNGMTSEKISVGIYDSASGKTVYVDCSDFGEDRYLTNISWASDRYLFIQVIDRSQHHMKLNQYDAADGSFVRTILTEDNEAWIEPQDPVHFFQEEDAGPFIYRTDNRDGFRNLYLCDCSGTVRRLTCVDADVEFIGIRGDWVYYTSAEVSPIENHLFRIKVSNRKSAAKAKISKPERLTFDEGWHSINLGETHFIDSWSSFNCPGIQVLRSLDGKPARTLTEATDPLSNHAQCEMEFGTVKSSDGKFDNYYRLYKPLGFDPTKKYPLIVYMYGGPHSQMVRDAWLGQIRMWEMVMAQKGYVVYVQDNRGTSNRGAEFEKAINRRCGVAESADQMAGIQALLERSPWIDRSRIGVHGWSYGGFMTITMLTRYPGFFKTGVAGGPVIDWDWYEVMYGERYMDTRATNPEGFEETSLIQHAGQLKDKLLICQGAIDETVVWEHSLSFVQKCIEQGIQLDYFPYPCDEHNMVGKARFHLYQKITDWFLEKL